MRGNRVYERPKVLSAGRIVSRAQLPATISAKGGAPGDQALCLCWRGQRRFLGFWFWLRMACMWLVGSDGKGYWVREGKIGGRKKMAKVFHSRWIWILFYFFNEEFEWIYKWFGTKPSGNLHFQTVWSKPSTNFTTWFIFLNRRDLFFYWRFSENRL
jgi:hypothetical protein